ncbi:dnaJ homolog subfamily C member 28 [Aricia agestis]|uniref:dnaJ homolog subfamily C member 28 n=1 Tax=Aricia agestis TaxID=91739 RepID=UPI001C203A4E|nr:dnaJ homolog subfamily C member 28 [Aricia agestis]
MDLQSQWFIIIMIRNYYRSTLLKMKAQMQSYKLVSINLFLKRSIATKKLQEKLEDSYKTLNIPVYSKQEVARQAFLDLAKKYHPDSCSSEADIEKFVAVENAFRAISKYNTGSSNSEEVETIVYNIKHTAPQHRQYLSFEGVGHGTPSQRQKQWVQARAQKAATNVMEHRISKAVASDKTLMKKGGTKKHDIKTKYGFDRLVEDLIQESMSKGEFENLSGKGKPLKDQNRNPYVDFTTHKLNEVLINNGFTPEWITMNKEIEQDIELLKEEIKKDRMFLGRYPLSDSDSAKWQKIYDSNKDLANSINIKINTYNLIVPLLNKQRLHVDFDKISNDILINGLHSVAKTIKETSKPDQQIVTEGDDIIGVILKAIGELFSFKDKKKDVN